ncbi:uncharacterized protein [Aristolochia californica]|uniref:uncharacterized protein n=1 Tax=Aristolochia californica TaxID=171875 RepID=UPI0035D96168
MVTFLENAPRSLVTAARSRDISSQLAQLAQKKKKNTTYHASTGTSSSAALSIVIPVTALLVSPVPVSSTTLTPEMVQQMIISIFSTFGISGKQKISTQPWYFDFGASNHMTNNVMSLSNVRKYNGNLHINTTDGSTLPISVFSDLSPSLADDQASGKVIVKGPKVGRPFPLKVFLSTFIPCSLVLSFACNVVGSGTKIWHKRLGHPNSDVLRILFKSGLLGNQDCTSLDTYFDYSSCKLGKNKVLPFPHHASHASHCFDLIHSDVWRIAPVVSHAQNKYFVTFIDDFSLFTWVCFLQAKSKVFVVFKRFFALIETQFVAHVEVLPSDSGSEFDEPHPTASLPPPHFDLALAPDLPSAPAPITRCISTSHSYPPARYKDSLVALGNRQEYGIDYEETFALVAKMTTVRTILTIAASQSWSLHQMDVTNAFLHDDLQEGVYMKLPWDMTTSSLDQVCKLRRPLYGLKQAPRAWFEKFRGTPILHRFTQIQYDSSLFYHKSAIGMIILLVYVDDIILTGTDFRLITKLQ